MILSHKYKFVCLNPPKTGSGFRELLLKDYADVSIFTHEREYLRHLPLRHWTSCQASNYIKNLNKDPDDYYWFTFVRNPWERIISWLNMLKILDIENGTEDNYDIESFIVSNYENPKLLFKNYMYRDGKLLDFIGSIENITEDLSFVLNKLNIDIPIGTHRDQYKKDFKKEIKKELSPKVIKMIADVEKEVIEMKNYKFEQ